MIGRVDARTRVARARFVRLLIDTPPARNRAGVAVRPWPVVFRNLVDDDIDHDQARRRLATLLADIDVPWPWALNHMNWAWYWWTVAVYRPTEHYFVALTKQLIRTQLTADVVADYIVTPELIDVHEISTAVRDAESAAEAALHIDERDWTSWLEERWTGETGSALERPFVLHGEPPAVLAKGLAAELAHDAIDRHAQILHALVERISETAHSSQLSYRTLERVRDDVEIYYRKHVLGVDLGVIARERYGERARDNRPTLRAAERRAAAVLAIEDGVGE